MRPDKHVDLTNCDLEPIHIPGSIQPHGCLLACDPQLLSVLRYSTNAGAMLGGSNELLGASIETLVGAEAAHSLRNALAKSSDPARPGLLLDLELAVGTFDAAVHRFKQTAIIELEPVNRARDKALELARVMIGRIAPIKDVERLLQTTARIMRGLLGYDRVMVYRFVEDGAGQVVAEARRTDLESFLGQWFPASDIPQQARTLYLRNTIRAIGDASGERIPIVPELDSEGAPLDLSFAHLRSVSAIHCEYLRNMGVAASMSISVIVDGELWGLIACHHYEPRTLPMAQRVAAELFGDFFSLHLHALTERGRLDSAMQARRALDRFLRLSSHHAGIGDLLRENLTELGELLPCHGVGIWVDGRWSATGATPPADAIPALAHFIMSVDHGKVWSTHALAQRLADAESYAAQASGVLSLPLSRQSTDYVFFFRRELIETLDWAGDPDKHYETGPLGDRLTPRRSFAIWKEIVHMRASSWSAADLEIAEVARSAFIETVLGYSESMADERRKSDVRQRMLNEELNHRVKNILAVIQSLVGHPVQQGRSLHEYVASLKGRIQALAIAHDQVVRGDGGGMLGELLHAELSPYSEARANVTLTGPDVWLDARAFSVMALVLHEMATNAAKYGALSTSTGHLDVAWQASSTGGCTIDWSERGGPPVVAPNRNGFGTYLIDRSIPYDLGGSSVVSYPPHGVQATFTLPSAHVTCGEASPHRHPMQVSAVAADPAHTPRPADDSLSLLLLEDQMLIAMDVEAMLTERGISQVISTGSVDDALLRLKQSRPDCAVLDLNLGAETSIDVARELRRREIPFVFATGYGDRSMVPPDLAGVPIVRKPYDGDALAAAIWRVLATAGAASDDRAA